MAFMFGSGYFENLITNSEVELGKFVGSLDFIRDVYQAISETSSSSICKRHTSRSGINVLAFECFPDHTIQIGNGEEFNLVSIEKKYEKEGQQRTGTSPIHQVFDFICTKVNAKISIKKAAVELFEKHSAELLNLRNELINSPLVITGQGMGGYLAILFALMHQHEVDVEESNGSKTAKRPICITFGSPLLGDEHLQGAISERPQWKSSFLNVVANTDPIANLFSLNSPYKPFCTFLFCTKSGAHTTFEDQEAILAVLDTMVSSNVGNSKMHDYSKELGSMVKKVLYREPSEFNESNLTPLGVGIVFQFRNLGVLNDISNDLIMTMEKKQTKMIIKSRNVYEPTKKLNDIKIILTYMEWYMKTRRQTGGYYDSYKNAESTMQIKGKNEAIVHQLKLNQYWKKIVADNDLLPQKEGAKLRKRWLYAGTNYRRIIEPLDIADYYKRGNTNYIGNRPNHYTLLEQWSVDDKKNLKPSEHKTKAASLTEDSCFWAHVEEALISLNKLKKGDLSSTTTIEQFEVYHSGSIKDFSLSPDVFVQGSSLVNWWSDYYTYKASSYDSELARYMKNESYKSYQ